MSDFLASHTFLIVSLLKVVVVLLVLLTAVAYLSWFERKVVAHIQSRWGPHRAGAHGLLQPLADGIKFLFKEDPTPAGVDRFVYFFAPALALTLAVTTIALIPFGPGTITIFGQETVFAVSDVNIGLLILFALTSLGVYGVALAGWSSNSKYPLLGGLRSSAQMVSYELALTLSVVGVLLLTGTFNFREIIHQQEGFAWGFLPRWNLFAWPAPQLLGFFIYFIAAIAETNRSPFDLAEAEQELVGGFHTEYASFKFAMFFMSEYANMVTVSLLASALFLGGWLSPFPDTPLWAWTHYLPAAIFGLGGLALLADALKYKTGWKRIQLTVVSLLTLGLAAVCALPGAIEFVQGPFWYVAKATAFLFIYVWVRGTLPRFRYDQLMNIGWKLLFPLALLNVVATSLAILAAQR